MTKLVARLAAMALVFTAADSSPKHWQTMPLDYKLRCCNLPHTYIHFQRKPARLPYQYEAPVYT